VTLTGSEATHAKQRANSRCLRAVVNRPQSHAGERLIEVGCLEVSDEQPVFSQEQRVISPSGLTQSIQHVGPHDPMPSLVFVHPVFLNLKLEANAIVIVHVKSALSYFLEGTWAETCATISILRHNVHMARQLQLIVLLAVLTLAHAAAADTLQGRWKLLAAEDLRANGEVGRLPWGTHPIGSIVVAGGWCYVQIMSSDTPSFEAGQPIGEQMKAQLLSSYIAYSGPCMIDETAGSVTLKVEAAWRPDYVGTEQKRFFRFENGKLLFGPAPNSGRMGTERLTRRLTLQRVE